MRKYNKARKTTNRVIGMGGHMVGAIRQNAHDKIARIKLLTDLGDIKSKHGAALIMKVVETAKSKLVDYGYYGAL